LAIYKSLAGRAPGGEYDDSPLVSER
jgi:hypothetical protein